jgi:thioredoxin reductase
MNEFNYDVIIVGGSFAGLAAGMSLGRSTRKVLIIDASEPCNRFTPHAHNFITHDGKPPAQIAEEALKQVLLYPTVKRLQGKVSHAAPLTRGFEIKIENGEQFSSRKLLFTTGLKDIMPDIPGFAECWGKTVIHCPYCHGYEVKGERTGVMANGVMAFDYAKLISNLTPDLTLFTNGPADFTPEQRARIEARHIPIIEVPITAIEHEAGSIRSVVLADGSRVSLSALYARPQNEQHSPLPQQMGCELVENSLLKIDMLQRTTVPGVYAAGDNSLMGRSVAGCVGAGSMAGAAINKELVEEDF